MVVRLTSFLVVTAFAFVSAAIAIAPSGARPGFEPPVAAAAVPPPAIAPRPPVGGPHVTGPARVIDGDTIDIGGTRIRLEGIDAPEAAQTCARADGRPWDCGAEATRFLSQMVRGASLDCRVKGQDKYGRTLATCYSGNVDINRQMVRNGYAWAFVRYSAAYVGEEAAARAARAGVWQGRSEPAWTYREMRWTAASDRAPEGCAIKGNVSRQGRIYHMPWSPWYGKVVMRAEKGTRWFCNESEAVGAGWRPAVAR